jgi:hypothetical protein
MSEVTKEKKKLNVTPTNKTQLAQQLKKEIIDKKKER